jgi:hypothetical protein
MIKVCSSFVKARSFVAYTSREVIETMLTSRALVMNNEFSRLGTVELFHSELWFPWVRRWISLDDVTSGYLIIYLRSISLVNTYGQEFDS